MLKTNEEINAKDIIGKRKIYGSIKMFWSTDLKQYKFYRYPKAFFEKNERLFQAESIIGNIAYTR